MSLTIVVLGLGSIGRRHLRVLRSLEDELDLDVVAVSRRPEACREALADGGRAESTLEAVGQIHAAIVATETSAHASDLAELQRRGVDTVLVEKPLASSMSAIEAVAWPRHVFVGYNLRFTRGIQALRESLPRIGPVYAANIEARSYLPDWRPGRDYRTTYAAGPDGGVLLDLSHEVDYARWLFGDVKGDVHARLLRSGRLIVQREDQASLAWTTDRGIEVRVELDYLAKPTTRQVRVYGETGRATWDLVRREVEIATNAGHEVVPVNDGAPDDTYRAQAIALIASVRHSAPDDRLATGADGLATMAICEAARLANKDVGT